MMKRASPNKNSDKAAVMMSNRGDRKSPTNNAAKVVPNSQKQRAPMDTSSRQEVVTGSDAVSIRMSIIEEERDHIDVSFS